MQSLPAIQNRNAVGGTICARLRILWTKQKPIANLPFKMDATGRTQFA